tara:strand:- start:504 stop:1046 length:543 start_codon:yes stop_codon:yes gene_type:complete
MKKLLTILVLGLFPFQLNAISGEIYTTVCNEHTYSEFGKKMKNTNAQYKIKYDAKNNILLNMGLGAVKKQFYKYSEREVKPVYNSSYYATATTYAAKTIAKLGKEIAVLKTIILKERNNPFIMYSFEVTNYVYPKDKQLAQTINKLNVKEFESYFLKNEKYKFIQRSRAYFKCEPENTKN